MRARSKALLGALFALLLAVGITAGAGTIPTAAPDDGSIERVVKTAVGPDAATAGYFNDVYHAADDSGYTAPIQIQCSDGRRSYLYKGQGSPGRCGFHVERIIVGYNQTVRCSNTIPPYGWLTYYTAEYNHVPSASSLRCYMQRPL